MKTRFLTFFTPIALSSLLTAAEEEKTAEDSAFSEPTIDLGCVVSDLEASIKFYTEAVGFTVSGEFEVGGDYAKDVGLTDGKSLSIKVLTLGEGEEATKLKLMQVEGGSAPLANDHIHTTLGFSYITIFVKSTDEAMARLKKAGVKPLAKGPLPLPANLNPEIALTVLRDPDGNFVELVGPKPKE